MQETGKLLDEILLFRVGVFTYRENEKRKKEKKRKKNHQVRWRRFLFSTILVPLGVYEFCRFDSYLTATLNERNEFLQKSRAITEAEKGL